LKVIAHAQDFPQSLRTVVTIGTFDGVHLGHQAILDRLCQSARAQHAASVVLTFYPHPRSVLAQSQQVGLLTALDEKIKLLRQTGLDYLWVIPFTADFASLSAEAFVQEYLVNALHAQTVIIGYDHRFGQNRSANYADLVNFGVQYGFDVAQIDAQTVEAVAVSSTKIRKAISLGQMDLATSYLGHPYLLQGKVVRGKQLGRTLGFPTANIQWDEADKLLPPIGVYAVRVGVDDKQYWGMLNLGHNPTVQDQGLQLEVHLLDFEGDLYGMTLDIFFEKRLRDEQRFASVALLSQQLQADEMATRHYFANRSD